MDASTGYPADTDLVAVTVVSNDGGLADALSTWILTAGTKRLDIFLRDTSYGVVAIDKDKNIYMSEALRQEYLPGPADAGLCAVD
jgi:thiamine biosynthesis lipoprotein